MELNKNSELRVRLNETNPVPKIISADYIQALYRMYIESETKECKDFAFLSILNILFYFYTKKENEYISTGRSRTEIEDFDSAITIALLKSLKGYKEKKGGVNFSFYLSKVVERDLYKEYKVLLPLYMPHITKNNIIRLFEETSNNNLELCSLDDKEKPRDILDTEITSLLSKHSAFSYLSDEKFIRDAETKDLLNKLKDIKYFDIFNYKYGFTCEPHTFAETAKKFDCSVKAVRIKINQFVEQAKNTKVAKEYFMAA